MAKRKVIIELRSSPARARLVAQAGFDSDVGLAARLAPPLPGIAIDETFPPVQLPAVVETQGGEETVEPFARMEIDDRPVAATWLLRGEVEDESLAAALLATAAGEGDVVGIFADVAVQSTLTCIGDPAVGTHRDVENRLDVNYLRGRGMTGRNVAVAIVDTGINLAYLHAHGKNPAFSQPLSWLPQPGPTPGQLPVGHGTMCAFDACIAAPECTLLDIALLRSQAPGGTVMEGLLSDGVRAYAHLRDVLRDNVGPGKRFAGLVVNNSWGMFHPSWDYPPGHPGNYSHNPHHPFNRIVATLERSGADILFAAGNCGRECPDGRCQNLTNGGIYGANAHRQVLSVAGVDVHRNRVGYSTIGPGRLQRLKPDVCGYTHFAGSGVYPHDGGTSAATPVVAGLMAAVRTKRPLVPQQPASQPARLRRLLCRTSLDRGAAGYDFEYGFGIVRGQAFAEAVAPVTNEEWRTDDTSAQFGAEETADVPTTAAAAGSVQTAFLRISPDAAPGSNRLIIRGLPRGTRSVSAWMTEWASPDQPHAGGARFDTISVQLFEDGTRCRVDFVMHWGATLPAAVQLMYA
jgi:subtilisin family serine protease